MLGQIEALDKQISECNKKVKHWWAEVEKLRAAAEENGDLEDEDEEDTVQPPPKEDGAGHGEEGDVEMENAEEKDEMSIGPEPKDPPVDKASNKWSLPTLSFAALEKYDKDELKESISILESERNTIAKNANMGAIAEYRKKEADYLARYVFE